MVGKKMNGIEKELSENNKAGREVQKSRHECGSKTKEIKHEMMMIGVL